MMEHGVTGQSAMVNVSRQESGKGSLSIFVHKVNSGSKNVLKLQKMTSLKELKTDLLRKLTSVTVLSCVFSMFQMTSI